MGWWSETELVLNILYPLPKALSHSINLISVHNLPIFLRNRDRAIGNKSLMLPSLSGKCVFQLPSSIIIIFKILKILSNFGLTFVLFHVIFFVMKGLNIVIQKEYLFIFHLPIPVPMVGHPRSALNITIFIYF